MSRLLTGLRWLFPRILPFVAPVLFFAAVFVFRKEFEDVTLGDLLRELGRIPNTHILGAVCLTATAYFLMTLCEWLAAVYAGTGLPYRRIGPVSFACTAVGHNFGNAIVVGGALRARLYSARGLRPIAISKIVVLYSLSYWIGYLVLAGLIFLLDPPAGSSRVRLPPLSVQVLGGSFLMLSVCYFAVAAAPDQGFARKLTLRWTQLRIPALRIAVPQTVLMIVDQTCAAGALYLLLDLSGVLPFPAFLGIFLLALVTGIASQVPGGLGVFETAMLLLLQEHLAPSGVLGALLVFRLVFYLIPFAISLTMILIFEMRMRARRKRVNEADRGEPGAR